MPYTIKRFNGTQVAIVNDGTVDNTVDLKLIGKNYAGYGEIQNENFVYLLENFANNYPPPRPSAGQVWFDSGSNKLKFYDSQARWRTTGGAEVGSTEPVGLTTGDFWYNTASKQLFAWDTDLGSFVLIGPQGVAGFGATEMRARKVIDTNDGVHAIIEALVNGATVYIISSDAAFTLKPGVNDITGFNVIRQGLTLAYTNDSNFLGQTKNANHRWWGTATDSDRLGGYLAGDYLRRDNVAFDTLVAFGDIGFTVGDSPFPYLKVSIASIDGNKVPVIQNQLDRRIIFQTTENSVIRTPMEIDGNNILPGLDNVTELGSVSGVPLRRFKAVHAITFNGTATQADKLAVGTNYVIASSAVSSGTIVARTNVSETINGINVTAGSVKANYFVGIATSANYADLAEKYLADDDYEVGTVVIVGGDKEVTSCQSGRRALGVVSENPAYMMNAELEGGTFIALKGRVPVKVYGMVKKGSELEAGSNGVAVVADPNSTKVFAIALETNADPGVKLVECVIL